MSIDRKRLNIKGCEAIDVGQFRSWSDAGKTVVGVPTVLSDGETRLGNIFSLAVLNTTRHQRHGRPPTSGNVTITNGKVLLVKRRTIHPAIGSPKSTGHPRRGDACKTIKHNS
jgi:hypothetical protein